MPKLKLTTRTVEKLRAPDPSGKQTLYWDTELRGFAVCVSGTTNGKSYVVQRDINGHSRRVTVGACNVLGLDQARKRAEGILADMVLGRDPKAKVVTPRLTLRAALSNYLTYNRKLRAKSREEYERNVNLYLKPWLDKELSSITPTMVVEKHAEIADEIAKKGRYSGEATANGVMRTLRSIWFHAAASEATLPPNPVGRTMRRAWFDLPQRERHVPAGKFGAFYAALRKLPNPIHADYLELLLLTGLRRAEAAALEWGDVDLEARVLRIPAVRAKSGKKLDLPMNDLVYDLLARRAALGKTKFVFPAVGGDHIVDPKASLALIKQTCGIAVSPHDLRRSFISVAESCDISAFALKKLVNHAVNDVTASYIQWSPERLREAAQRVADKMKVLINGNGATPRELSTAAR